MRSLIVLASALWLISCGASLLALYWNVKAGSRRLLSAFISSSSGLLVGYWGMSRIQFNASKTVNGHLEWAINSRWFFVGALIVGAASLTLTLWNWRKLSGRCDSGRLVSKIYVGFGDEPVAAPNGGSANPAVQSGVTELPPSVS